MRICLWGALLGLFLAVPAWADHPKPLEILRVTPTGEDVPPGRQIVIEFDRPVVPVGKMDRTAAEVGVSMIPKLNCQWRWLNTSALSCNLDEKDAMEPATRYDIAVDPVILAEDGGKLAAPATYTFTTQRPDIAYTGFKTWRGPVSPVIRTVFNQPVSLDSAEKHLFLQSAKGDRFPVLAKPDLEAQKLPDYVLVPGEKSWLRIEGAARKSDDRKTSVKGIEARRVWLLEPARPLASDSSFSLKIEPGLVSAEGPEAGAGARDIVSFDTYPDFAFAGIRCVDNAGSEILLEYGKSQDPFKLCNPMRSVALAFTAPVLRSRIKDNATMTPSLSGGRKDFNPWGDENRDWSSLGDPHQSGRLYYVGLPVGLKAAQTYTLTLPGKPSAFKKLTSRLTKIHTGILDDEFGRTLAEPVQMMFSTNHRNPNYELTYHDAVLESGVDSDIPFYVNNLNSFTFEYRAVFADGMKTGQSRTQSVRNIQDIQYAVPAGIRAMLDGKSGALFGRVKAKPDTVGKWEGDARLFAQVTPYEAHLKLGHFSSLLWVTDLATGQPVADAKVRIYKGSFINLSTPDAVLASAETDSYGLATLPGSDTLDPQQELLQHWEDKEDRLFVEVVKGKEMALLPLSDAFNLPVWNFTEDGTGSWNRNRFGHIKSWGMTAQGIYRAGDVMQYKVWLRHQDDRTLTPPPAGRYTLEIVDPAGKTVESLPDISFNSFGAYSGEFPVPESAAVGWYGFRLKADFSGGKAPKAEEQEYEQYDDGHGRYTLYPMRVLVSDFTPAPFRVTTELGGDRFHPGDTMPIETRATLHSGGAYGDAAARATVTLRARGFSSDDPQVKDFQFNTLLGGSLTEQIFQKSAILNDKGEWIEKFTLPQEDAARKPNIIYGTLEVESAVQDDRGKSVASVGQALYIGVDRFVGLKSPQWFYEARKPVTIQSIVVDENGKPAKGTKVAIRIEKELISVAKVKGAGNAYLSDITREWKKVGSCDAVSAETSQDCTFTPDSAGSYHLVADIHDTKGRAHESDLMIWVSGDDYVQWNTQDESLLPIVPESKAYKVGDTARFLVKNPYPGAKALVTVERYGVIDRFVRTLEDSAPVLEIPVKPDYLPGFYLSVLVVSPRVDRPVPAVGQVDLGKPAFRMGYVTVPVNDPYKEIIVQAKADQDVYRPRDMVRLDLQAMPRRPDGERRPVELAVTVLDDAVFDLIGEGRNAFDPYRGFYGLDPLDMRNYSLLYRIAGRQKFEKKGANPGGDGGADLNMRTLFKYVSYWDPDIKTDAEGRAHLEFQAPDNLTGWHVLAVATTSGDLMGLGESGFRVNRPTEIRPVMPNQVREGDTFMAGFSVMNRTDKTRTLRVTLEASGDVRDGKPVAKAETVALEPYKRTTVYLPVEAALLPLDREAQKGEITFKASAADHEDSDGMTQSVPVSKTRVTEVAATYGTTLEAKTKESIAFPKDIYTDTGDVSVVLSPSVIANLGGAFRYMRDYPYPCWEQVLTRAVMAAHYGQLKPWLPQSVAWDEAKDLPQAMLDKAANFQAPNGGMTYFMATDEHADPYLSAYTALAFTWLQRGGYKVPEEVERKLQAYLLAFLRQDTAPDFYQGGMTSTVRAVALAALADQKKVTADDVMRYQPHLKQMSLFGKAHFLEAALSFDETAAAAKEAADMIFAAGSETGGKFMFNETLDDGYARILATPLRDNCAVLSALIAYGKKDGSLIGDKPFKLVRSITQSRGRRDYWENTQENMFCMNGLVDYARAYETVGPDMQIRTALDGQAFGQASFEDFTDAPETLIRPLQADDPGTTRILTLDKDGEGRFYYAARLRYASKTVPGSTNAGMDIQREYSVRRDGKWVVLKPSESLKRGDTVRVDLYLSLPTARNFVVVDDPLPGGLETVNRDLATSSSVDDAAAGYDRSGGSAWFKYDDWKEYNMSFWSFYHRELRHDSARFYADWLPAGNYHLSYMAQGIADGTFAAPPVRAEEMYDPDVYGRGAASELTVITAP